MLSLCRQYWTNLFFALLILGCSMALSARGQDAATPEPATTSNPDIPVAELEWRLKPLTAEDLGFEADGWQGLVKQKVEEIADTNIAILKKNEEMEEAEAGSSDQRQTEKTNLLERLAQLTEERTMLLDRANLVVDELERKGGDEAKVERYRTYMKAASGVKVDVSDTEALWSATKGWITSKEGGLRWLKNIALFVIIIIAFFFLSRILGNVTTHALARTRATSNLLRTFLINTIRRLTLIIGVIVGLAALEINIGPLLAVIGAAGFVVAFALQDSLGNFASGLLIMMFRPFDVGDAVEVGGVAGKVEEVNLLSTHLKTFDNKSVLIPNNEVWGGVITNITASPRRRVDMVFGIGYDDDIDKAQRILEDIVSSHDLVLKDPEPVIKMNELADSSVNFIVRPWTLTDDYWTVYWDMTREVKKRFDQEGISIPYPQRDIHVYNQGRSDDRSEAEGAA
ncbi:MAG: mechanosensitive ion channel family protein [Candidatus Omnitrophica bacterium]|nr:mechanosensitive ion channel family protein [Candidatus Omnitrophota bacterium]MCA9434172.1 mechanosensitive ion channel family protein [Candidatus Omnitrophota bacterium]MCB9768962.1 mechanosensitive ion channel family protein [Candidatus Omnitrophota bacterium]MCB9782440.1 mechanosensitive ion channel family protein [Candidatus Omnitrophota bacterium]